jgi:hypothetical protein
LDAGGGADGGIRAGFATKTQQVRRPADVVPRGTMDETSSLWALVRSLHAKEARASDCSVSFYGSHAVRAKRLIPKRSADPRVTAVEEQQSDLNALDLYRRNREEPKLHAG